MDRSVDEIRYRASIDPTLLNRLRSMVPAPQHDDLRQFLEGLPQRYLQTRLPEQIRDHFQLAENLGDDSVQLDLRPHRQLFDLTVITRDRGRLFADVAGALAAWGMNIVKAGAFSNDAGVVVDSFQFSDVFRTIELNPSERERFLAYLHDVVARTVPVEAMLEARSHMNRPGNLKVEVATRIQFDSESSSLKSSHRTCPASCAKSPSPSAPTTAISKWRSSTPRAKPPSTSSTSPARTPN
jgi:[protein-PII] uridylyltransferase